MNFFETEGARIAFETVGAGEPLVLLPGFASGIWSWRHQVAKFAEDFNVITFDPRGVSMSLLDGGPNGSIEQIAKDVAALLDHLKIESANILGISFGGFVAQELALRYPKRVTKLVLACTSSGGPGHVLPSPEVLMAFASVKGLNSAQRIRQHLAMAFQEEFLANHADVVEDFCDARERNVVPEDVYLEQLRSAMTFDLTSEVPRIETDTLVLTGDADTIVPMQNSLNLAAAIPGAELRVVKGVGHMFFVEQAEDFNEIVIEFLKR